MNAGMFDAPTVASSLLHYGADTQAADDNGNTGLHYACMKENVGLLRALLHDDADGAASAVRNDYKQTPLMYAAYHNHVTTMRMLLQHGSDIEARDQHGNTAAFYACAGGALNALKLLIQRGASVSRRNKDGKSPRAIAARHKHKVIVVFLQTYVENY